MAVSPSLLQHTLPAYSYFTFLSLIILQYTLQEQQKNDIIRNNDCNAIIGKLPIQSANNPGKAAAAITTREQITYSIYSIQKDDLQWEKSNTLPSTILKPINIKPNQLKKARKNYLSNCPDDKILILIDYTLFSSGKTGCVFSTDAFYNSDLYSYASKHRFPYPLKYSNIKSIARGYSTSHLVLTLHSGEEAEIFFNIYSNYIYVALNRILEFYRNSKPIQKNSEFRKQDMDLTLLKINHGLPETVSNLDDPLKLNAISELLTVLTEIANSKNAPGDYDLYVQYMTLVPLKGISMKNPENNLTQ